jgi:FkbM family methyltransferase
MPRPTTDEIRRFLEEKKAEIGSRALMGPPAGSATEAEGVAAFARLFHVLDGTIRIRHPHLDLHVELSQLLGPRISYLITTGDYELVDLELLDRYVVAGDVVLELGGGAGLTAAVSAKRSRQPVVVVEPDDRLFPVIRRQVEINGGSVSFVHGAVVEEPAPSGLVDFYLDEEIWFSSLRAAPEVPEGRARTRVEVPALSLGGMLERVRPSVLMVDVEGTERGLFLADLPHAPRLILIEIHTLLYGEKVAADTVQAILDRGYRFIDQRGWTYVFQRGA